LLCNKEKIQSTLGTELTWSRRDGAKSSEVFYQLDGVSIENEVDWLKMARFHPEWSNKFYDVIVPYLSSF
jgi:hypothetical protein